MNLGSAGSEDRARTVHGRVDVSAESEREDVSNVRAQLGRPADPKRRRAAHRRNARGMCRSRPRHSASIEGRAPEQDEVGSSIDGSAVAARRELGREFRQAHRAGVEAYRLLGSEPRPTVVSQSFREREGHTNSGARDDDRSKYSRRSTFATLAAAASAAAVVDVGACIDADSALRGRGHADIFDDADRVGAAIGRKPCDADELLPRNGILIGEAAGQHREQECESDPRGLVVGHRWVSAANRVPISV